VPAAPLPKHPLLPSFNEEHIRALMNVQDMLAEAHGVATAQPQEADDISTVVKEWTETLRALAVGQTRMVPGGWVGLRSSNALTHLVMKTGPETYAFVTCNVGSGLNYHPSRPGPPPKMLYKTAIRINDVPVSRMTDPAFWLLFFTQWMRQTPSEYHRMEVVYDVLLPWLAGRLLPLALADTQTDPYAAWRTRARSGTGFFGSVREAMLYHLRSLGLPPSHLKQLMAALRWLALDKARCDLRVMADPEGTLREGLCLGLGSAPSPEGVGELPPQAMEALMATRLLCRDGSEAPASRLLTQAAQREPTAGTTTATFALYFGGAWCQPCTAFKPLLMSAYSTVRARQQPWTVVYVPLDKTQDEFDKSFGEMPDDWVSVPFHDEAMRKRLTGLFKVSAVPTLVLFGQNGRVYTVQGVRAVRSDPDCHSFPWSPAALAAAAAARGPSTLGEHEVLLLAWACRGYVNSAIKEHVAGRLAAGSLGAVRAHIDRLVAMAGELPNGCLVAERLGINTLDWDMGNDGAMDTAPEDDSGETQMAAALRSSDAQPALKAEGSAERLGLANCDLLQLKRDDGRYAGVQTMPVPPQPVNTLDLPELVRNTAEALQALETTQQVCYLLLDRARESSTASRLVLQYEVLVIIGHVFTQVLPIPRAGQAGSDDDIWGSPLPREMQLKAMEHIYHLALTYGQMWQAVEQAPRDCDCERAVVVACMLAMFDAVLRQPAPDAPLVLSVMLNEGGGYRLSTTVRQNNVPLAELASNLEIRDPRMLQARSDVLAYLTAQEKTCRNVLFEMRQPDKIEVKKYGSTLLFLRGMLERLGYELMPRDMRIPKPEIEMLVEWMVGEQTTLAKDHPEWAMTRDMVAIFKVGAVNATCELFF
jgi:hypothetical protein